MCCVALRRRVPAQRAAELAGLKAEDVRHLFQPIDAGGVQFQFPGAGIIVAVGADGVRHVVVVELADPRGEVAGLAKRLRQADLRRNGLAEDLAVWRGCRVLLGYRPVSIELRLGPHSGNWQ